jgi:hypothetical protein
MKIIYNSCYGGLSFSDEFVEEFNKRYPEKKIIEYDLYNVVRYDQDAVALVEEMGLKKSSGACAHLNIEEIPDGVEHYVSEYDGMEDIQWSLPKNTIIKELIELLKGRKKEDELSKFTQMVLKEDGDVHKATELLSKTINQK